jgi:hypothetical protein
MPRSTDKNIACAQPHTHTHAHCRLLTQTRVKSHPTPNSLRAGIIKFFPPRESLVSDIPAGDGNVANLFLRCREEMFPLFENFQRLSGFSSRDFMNEGTEDQKIPGIPRRRDSDSAYIVPTFGISLYHI